MADPKPIPLHDFHARQGARFVDFGGWNMPVQYSSILEEHRAVRETAGLFDVSHMGEFFVEGASAGAFLDYLLTNRISAAAIGKAVYSPMCAPDGGVIDDLIVYRIGTTQFMLCVNAGNISKDFAWIHEQAEAWPEPLDVANRSADFCLLALQGPQAETILERAGFTEAAQLKRFHHAEWGFGNAKIRACRTGYTGEDGFELFVAPAEARSLAEALLEAGTPVQLQLCGLGARDSLRLEAGLPLYGHELSAAISPLEAGLSWAVKMKKEDFIGKAALRSQKENGLKRKLVFFKLPGRRIARAGTPVLDAEDRTVGEVVSGTSSPMTGGPIGSALIESSADSKALKVDLRRNRIELMIAKPPLHG
ncbi:MAG: glycine cleavage system aminomethyltransferase GcvT [Opitutales bacterium]